MSIIADLIATLDRSQREDLIAELNTKPEKLPLRRDDLHARALFAAASKRVVEWVPKTAKDVGIPSVTGPLERLDILPGLVTVAPLDEDTNAAHGLQEKVMRSLHHLPLVEDTRQWKNADEAEAVISQYLAAIQPQAFTIWLDLTSDATISLLAFQGIAAHLLVPIDEVNGAAFMVDLSWMGGLPVRENNEPLGACAYFAADRTLLRIHTSYDDITRTPEQSGWEHAKWHWKCAVFAYVTVADHLGGLHFVLSELMMQSTREQLPADHPLRRLLKPHIYGVSTVNTRAAFVLAPKGGIAHRVWPFTFESLAKLLTRGMMTATFEPFPDTMAAKRIDALGDKYPYATDGLALHAICKSYAADYLALYFPGNTIVSDPAVRAWWRQLSFSAPYSGLTPLTSHQQVVELVGQFIFLVSGYHAQVGADTQYLSDPRFVGGKVRAGSQMADVQSTIQILTLNAVTGLKEPKLLDDFTHMFLDQHRSEAVAVFRRFQSALLQLGKDIDARNEHRDLPLRTFHPAMLDSAVSK